MVEHPCPIHPETLVRFQTAAAHAFARSRSPRLSQAHLQTHLSCAEARLLRQRGCWTATLWASSVGIAFGGVDACKNGSAHGMRKGVNCIALADVRPMC